MPTDEAPDFEQTARDILDETIRELPLEEAIIVALRQAWNARGAILIDPVTNAVDDWVRAGGGTYDELQLVVEQTIKKLDR